MTLKQLAKHKKDVMSKRLVNQYIDSIKMDMIIEKEHTVKGMHIIDGRFRSPYAILFPEQMPGPLQWAHWRGYLPMKRRGVCIHLAGTGDHSYFRREYGLVNALCQEGIGAILLQNPFYTDRKPPQQFRSSLENVTDLFVMGAALISECNYLIKWAFKEGYGPVALSGVGWKKFDRAIAPAINYSQLQKQIEDEHYLTKLRNIPDVTWIDEMVSFYFKII
uniref:DUF169 domain-containing protein n=1 Tax=Heterorhabditis bacteriophora TaxID=37862 RepID=A0A1I7WFS9_HETBA